MSLPVPAPHQLLTNPLQSFEQLTAPSPTAVITAGTLILLLWNTSITSPTVKETSSGMWRMENSTCHQEWHQYAITQSSQLTVAETQEAGCDPQSTEGSSTSFLCTCVQENLTTWHKHASSKNWKPSACLVILWLYCTVYLLGVYTQAMQYNPKYPDCGLVLSNFLSQIIMPRKTIWKERALFLGASESTVKASIHKNR